MVFGLCVQQRRPGKGAVGTAIVNDDTPDDGARAGCTVTTNHCIELELSSW